MKLISRKSLVAVACSAAMITGATVAPAMAAEPGAGSANIVKSLGKKDETTPSTTAAAGNENGDKGKKNAAAGSVESPKELGEWAKAVAAIISTLTAIWTFVQKFLLKK